MDQINTVSLPVTLYFLGDNWQIYSPSHSGSVASAMFLAPLIKIAEGKWFLLPSDVLVFPFRINSRFGWKFLLSWKAGNRRRTDSVIVWGFKVWSGFMQRNDSE